ncbi:MAG: hypothetical protein AAGL29_07270 [Bacteroidota bacterium]
MKKKIIALMSLVLVVFSMTTVASCRKDSGEEPYREYNEDSSLEHSEHEVALQE